MSIIGPCFTTTAVKLLTVQCAPNCHGYVLGPILMTLNLAVRIKLHVDFSISLLASEPDILCHEYLCSCCGLFVLTSNNSKERFQGKYKVQTGLVSKMSLKHLHRLLCFSSKVIWQQLVKHYDWGSKGLSLFKVWLYRITLLFWC